MIAFRQILPGFGFFCFVSLTVCAQTLNTNKIDSLLHALSSRDLAFGSLAISIDSKLQYQHALGYAKIGAGDTVRTNTNTRYRIGSVSKLFTAAMIFQLIEEEKVHLDQRLSDFYPDLPNASVTSIRDLLNHQSGLYDYTKAPDFNVWMDQPKSQDEMIRMIRKGGSVFMPGEKHEYSNTNYLLLGYIIEKVENTSLNASLHKRIVSRLSLKNTYIGEAIDADRKEAFSYKFIHEKWEVQKRTHMSILQGAGSIVSTPSDMLVFINALFDGKLVQKSSLKVMTSLSDDYGHGVFANFYGSKPSYGHNGRIEEFYSALWYFPGEGLAIAYCTNAISFPRKDILEGVLKICFREAYQIPFSSLSTLRYNSLDQYTGKYRSDTLPEALVTNMGNQLMIVTNGARMPLSRISQDYFYYAGMGYYFEFSPATNKLEVKETDNTYLFYRSE